MRIYHEDFMPEEFCCFVVKFIIAVIRYAPSLAFPGLPVVLLLLSLRPLGLGFRVLVYKSVV